MGFNSAFKWLTRFDQRPTTFLVRNGPDNSVHSEKYRCCHGLFLQRSIIRSTFGHWPVYPLSLPICFQPNAVSLAHNFVRSWSRVFCHSVSLIIRILLPLGHDQFLPIYLSFYHRQDVLPDTDSIVEYNTEIKHNTVSEYVWNLVRKMETAMIFVLVFVLEWENSRALKQCVAMNLFYLNIIQVNQTT